MEVVKLLQYLQELIETSQNVPIMGKAMVDKKELLEVLEEIINYLPDEFKKAQWISQEKERILQEAKDEVEIYKEETYDMLRREIENHDIIKEASVKAEEIVSSARREAKNMRLNAKDYAHEILCDLDKELSEKGERMILSIKEQSENYLKQLDSEIFSLSATVRANIKELRDTVK
jgi:vacuolar-type H+-ATPase subunit H